LEVSGLTPGWSTKILHSTEKKEKERNRKKKERKKANKHTNKEWTDKALKQMVKLNRQKQINSHTHTHKKKRQEKKKKRKNEKKKRTVSETSMTTLSTLTFGPRGRK